MDQIMGKLQGKVALVTGASKGIGAAIAKHLASEGAKVVVNYATSKEGAHQVVAEIARSGGKAISIQANVSDPAEIQRLVAEAVKAYGHLDILVNNAGVYNFAPLEEITPEHFHKQFNLNVLGLLLLTKEAVKHFPKTGGSIINIGSIASLAAIATSSVYSATKAAVNAITKSLGEELGPRKIRVNAVNPGMVATEGIVSTGIAGSDFQKETEAQTPLGRIGKPEDIAPSVAFLASDDASWITGTTLYITGGWSH